VSLKRFAYNLLVSYRLHICNSWITNNIQYVLCRHVYSLSS